MKKQIVFETTYHNIEEKDLADWLTTIIERSWIAEGVNPLHIVQAKVRLLNGKPVGFATLNPGGQEHALTIIKIEDCKCESKNGKNPTTVIFDEDPKDMN